MSIDVQWELWTRRSSRTANPCIATMVERIGFETGAIILQVFLLAGMKSAQLVFAQIKL
jgi:hypothetical protein